MTRRRLRTVAGLSRLVWSYAAFGVLVHIVPLERLVRLAWRAPARRERAPELEARLVAQAIKLQHLFQRADRGCLPRSLTLYRALSRAGAAPQLVIGFRREGDALAGHAWVCLDDRPLAEPEDLLDSLTATCAFGLNGARIPPPPAFAPR